MPESTPASVPSLAFKERVILAVVDRLRSELNTVVASARAAHEAATHAESSAEDQYDTRGIEASYLAGAQAQRVGEIERRLQVFQMMAGATTSLKRDTVEVGALVTLRTGSRKVMYFLVGEGGGTSVQVDGMTVNLITPSAPLGEQLLGRKAGDEIDLEFQGQAREYEVLEVS